MTLNAGSIAAVVGPPFLGSGSGVETDESKKYAPLGRRWTSVPDGSKRKYAFGWSTLTNR